MNSRTLAWVAAALVAVLGIGWVALREMPSSIVPPHAPDVAASVPESDSILDLAMPVPTKSTDISSTRGAIAEEIALESVPAARTPEDGEWLEGRVQFPPGTPSDERVVVSAVVPAISNNYRPSQPERFDVDAEGRFRVRIPDRAWTLELDVEGRYLHTPVARRIELNVVHDEIVLRPQLGACMRVHFVLTDRAVQRGVDLTHASVSARPLCRDVFYLPGLSVPQPLNAGNTLEVRGLDVEYSRQLTASVRGCMSVQLDPLTLVAGEVREIDVVLDAGARFSGIVRDEQGAPIESADIGFLGGSLGTSGPLARRVYGRTDATGRFQIERSERGETRLWFGRDGYATRQFGIWNVEAGLDVADLDVVLVGGSKITGSVRFPDGRPVRNARVAVERVHAIAGEPRRSAEIGSDGSFEVLTVANDPLTLTVLVRSRTDSLVRSSLQVDWTARAGGVRAPTVGVELVLSCGESVRGRVVDDLGLPIAGASVLALPDSRDSGFSVRSSEPTDESGTFEVPALVDGPWRIVARTSESAFSEHVPIEMPRDAARAFDLVVTRPAVITGRVVDSTGATIGGAHVELEAADEALTRRTFLPSANSIGDGTFRIAGVPIGALRVFARREGFARSAALEVVTAIDATSADVELVLPAGGRIDVTVFDRDGIPIDAQIVALFGDLGVTPLSRSRTDQDGRCFFEHVDLGALRVGTEWVRGRRRIDSVNLFMEESGYASVVLREQ